MSAACGRLRASLRNSAAARDITLTRTTHTHAEQPPVPPPTEAPMAWWSDAIAELLRSFELEHVSLNPGASYRGLHDSIVNYLGNERPEIVLCLHEEHAVALAHGYAKVTERPMAVALHTNVGLMHATMALFNAFCDRVPMLVHRRHRPVRRGPAPAVDRLDPHGRRPGRADPLVTSSGTISRLGPREPRSARARQRDHAHQAERARLRVPRRRRAGVRAACARRRAARSRAPSRAGGARGRRPSRSTRRS